MRKGPRHRGICVLVLVIVLYLMPANVNAAPLPTPEIGAVILTEHGSQTYLGDGQWRYRSSIGETNAWDGSEYVRYIYDPENRQVTIGTLTFTHGPEGVITVSKAGSGQMIGALRWFAQYYYNDDWQNFTFDNYEFLGAVKTAENATVYQRWWSTNGELNVSYTYHYWNELKMRAQATNLAVQSVPVRVLWALVDIQVSPDYTLILDNGVAVGVELGNEQAVYWHDVAQVSPEIAINPVLDKENRRAAVVFGNMSSILGQYETMDIDPTYTVAADEDDDYWTDIFGTPAHVTTSTSIDFRNYTLGHNSYRGQIRFALSINPSSTIISADFYAYELIDSGYDYHRMYRIDETNVGSLEADSSLPSLYESIIQNWQSDGGGAEWLNLDVTDHVQYQVNLAGWNAGYYIGFGFTTNAESYASYTFEDYSHAGTHHSYLDIEFSEGAYDYVDQLSDLHPPSDIGIHSSFAEEQDKDGNYDTLTEEDTAPMAEYLATAAVDDGGDFGATLANCYDGDWSTYAEDTVFSNADDYPLLHAYGFDSVASGSGTIAQVDIIVRMSVSGLPGSSDEWGVTLDVGASTGNVLRAMSKADYVLNNLTFTDVTEPNGGGWSWAEIQAAQVHIDGEKAGGSDGATVRIYEFAFKVTIINYDLDLEIGWVTANYDETNEYLCIFGGTQGSEALRVDVYSGGWVNVISDLSAGWNNVSVHSYLTDSTFEIRFTDTDDDAVTADEWEVEAVLLHTWAGGAEESVTLYELIEFSGSTNTIVNLSTTVSEMITLSDSIVASAVYHLIVLEQIIFSESVSVGLIYIVTILELLGLAATVAVSQSAGYTSFETIGLASSVVASASLNLTINETIDLFSSVSAEIIEAGQYYVTIYEVIDLSGAVSTILDTAVTIQESIGLADSTITVFGAAVAISESIDLFDSLLPAVGGYISVFESLPLADSLDTVLDGSVLLFEQITVNDTVSGTMSAVLTLFETIPLLDSVSTVLNPSPVYSIVIYEVLPIIGSELVEGGLEGINIFYDLFLSANMWGYLGPIGLVVIGYFLAQKERILGVLWFIVECLFIATYLTMIDAHPGYWWQILILIIGGIGTCVFPSSRRR